MIVVGAGRVGQALQGLAASVGRSMTLVGRTEGWDALEGPAGVPVLVAVRNDDLPEVIGRTPPARREDLVFVQNGAFRELLAEQGVADTTRALLYFMVRTRGGPLVPGLTNWCSGRHGEVVAAFFRALGLDAKNVDWARFSYYELEKLLWLACHGLLCERHDATVGTVAADHRPELAALCAELLPVGEAAWGVEAPIEYVVDRLAAYSATIPEYRASVKEWRYRNGWLRTTAASHGVATPLHEALLHHTGHLPRDE